MEFVIVGNLQGVFDKNAMSPKGSIWKKTISLVTAVQDIDKLMRD